MVLSIKSGGTDSEAVETLRGAGGCRGSLDRVVAGWLAWWVIAASSRLQSPSSRKRWSSWRVGDESAEGADAETTRRSRRACRSGAGVQGRGGRKEAGRCGSRSPARGRGEGSGSQRTSSAGGDRSRTRRRRRVDRRRLGQTGRQRSELPAVVRYSGGLSQAASRISTRRSPSSKKRCAASPKASGAIRTGTDGDCEPRPTSMSRRTEQQAAGLEETAAALREITSDRREIRGRREPRAAGGVRSQTNTPRRAPRWCDKRSQRWMRSQSLRSRSARS